MLRVPGDNSRDPERIGRLGRLMQRRHERIAALVSIARGAAAGAKGQRAHTRLSRATDLRDSLRRYQAGEDTTGDRVSHRGSLPHRPASLRLGASSSELSAPNHRGAAKWPARRGIDLSILLPKALLSKPIINDRHYLHATNEVRLTGRLNHTRPMLVHARNYSQLPSGSSSSNAASVSSLDGRKDAAGAGLRIGTRLAKVSRSQARTLLVTDAAAHRRFSPVTSSSPDTKSKGTELLRHSAESLRDSGGRLSEAIAVAGPAASTAGASLRLMRRLSEPGAADLNRDKAKLRRLAGSDAHPLRHSPRSKGPPLL